MGLFKLVLLCVFYKSYGRLITGNLQFHHFIMLLTHMHDLAHEEQPTPHIIWKAFCHKMYITHKAAMWVTSVYLVP